jgi:pyruvate decarboxylase
MTADLLKTEINLTLPKNDAETEGEVLNTILEIIYKAKNPVVLADACSIRHHVIPEVHELLEKLKIPCFVTPMGKGAIDETHPQYGGVYIGEISLPDVKQAVEASDCVLSIGALLSDFNTVRSLLQLIAGIVQLPYFPEDNDRVSFKSYQSATCDVSRDWDEVLYYLMWTTNPVLKKIVDKIESSKLSRPIKAEEVVSSNHDLLKKLSDSSSTITHEWLWPTVGNFFRPKDVIITETGTAFSLF